MSKYVNALLVFLYVILTIFCFLLVLVIGGVRLPDRMGFLIMIGWVFFCFCSAYIFAGWGLLFPRSLRKPLLAEEQKLGAAFREVVERAGHTRPFILRIQETNEWSAFATGTRTVVVSKGLLEGMSDDELKGVLAHELGHLSSGDPLIVSAYVTAAYLPRVVGFVYAWVKAILLGGFVSQVRVQTNRGVVVAKRFNLLAGIFWVVVVLAVLAYFHLMNALIAVLAFVVLFTILNFIVRFLTLLLARLAEYRQDAYAHQLGFGEGLRKALERLAGQAEQTVSQYYIVFHSAHPVIYNRIRRLEKLEGLRR